MSEYLNNPSISRSDIVLFMKSRRQFRGVKDGILGYPRDLEPQAKKDTLELGTCTHLMALEPEKRGEIEFFDGRRAGKEWKDFKRRNAGKIILTTKAFVSSLVMGAAVRCQLGGVLSRAVAEHPIQWKEEVDGVEIQMKALLDIYIPSERLVMDVKTTDNNSQQEFRREIRKWKYWVQDAHYSTAVANEVGCETHDVDFIFAAVAKGLAAEMTARAMPLVGELATREELEDEITRRVQQVAPLLCRLHRIPYDERALAINKRIRVLREYVGVLQSGDWSDPEEHVISECGNVVD